MKAKDFSNGIRAAYGFFYIQTYEMGRCLESIQEMIEEIKDEFNLKLSVWDFEDGVADHDTAMATVEWSLNVIQQIDESQPWTVFILKNFDWFLSNPTTGQDNYSVIQALQNREDIYCGDENRKIVVVVGNSPFSQAIPSSLEKQFLSLEFGLPDRDEIKSTLDFIIYSASDIPNFQKPSESEIDVIIDSLKGLTIAEVKAALSFSIVKHGGKIDINTLAEIRDQGLEETAGIKAIDVSSVDPEKIKGMKLLKDFVLNCIQGGMKHLFKGVMLLGPPGTGKTTFFKWLAKVTGMRLYFIEVAELFGGLVGDSEKLMKALLDVLPMLTPSIVVFDEIEKALAGMKGSNDGGTTQRSLAQLLKFMSDGRPENLYIFATCNNIQGLPPEWVRPGRWSTSPFFIDLPTEEEKAEILKYYQSVYNVKGKPTNWEGWTGAEIEEVCANTAMLGDMKFAEKTIIPVSKTMEDEISNLRRWAERRCIMASEKLIPNGKPKKRALKM